LIADLALEQQVSGVTLDGLLTAHRPRKVAERSAA